jgi:hypothetical protein
MPSVPINKSSSTYITMTFDTNIMLLWFIPHLAFYIATTTVSMVAVHTSEVGTTLVKISAHFGNISESNVASNCEVSFTLSRVHDTNSEKKCLNLVISFTNNIKLISYNKTTGRVQNFELKDSGFKSRPQNSLSQIVFIIQ